MLIIDALIAQIIRNCGGPSRAVDRSKLPVVVPMPETKFHETIPDHTDISQTETDPINEILFFDERKPEGRVFEELSVSKSIFSKKIMIEAMVLEISSQALDDLAYSGFNPDKQMGIS